jgi:hypothetical protein
MHLAIAAFDGYEHMPSALNVAPAPGLGVDRALRRVSFVFSGGTRGVGMLSINIFVLDLCFVASERSGGWVSPCALQRGEGTFKEVKAMTRFPKGAARMARWTARSRYVVREM